MEMYRIKNKIFEKTLQCVISGCMVINKLHTVVIILKEYFKADIILYS